MMALVSKTYGRLLAFLLSWLGFSAILVSCTDYGCVSNEIKPEIKGSVVFGENEIPIQGIRAVLKSSYTEYDTAYTAKNGGFFLQCLCTRCEEDSWDLYVELQDIDGDANGSFENVEIPINSKSDQNLDTIKMTPKE